jgi:hypothetical protein
MAEVFEVEEGFGGEGGTGVGAREARIQFCFGSMEAVGKADASCGAAGEAGLWRRHWVLEDGGTQVVYEVLEFSEFERCRGLPFWDKRWRAR